MLTYDVFVTGILPLAAAQHILRNPLVSIPQYNPGGEQMSTGHCDVDRSESSIAMALRHWHARRRGEWGRIVRECIHWEEESDR
jgi:hypothetical protein